MAVLTVDQQLAGMQAMRECDGLLGRVPLMVTGEMERAQPRNQRDQTEHRSDQEYDRRALGFMIPCQHLISALRRA